METIEIYTDGSCIVNEKIGGWAIITPNEIQMGGKHPTTNNEMELHAIYQAVKLSQKYPKITIYTDSNYSVQTLNQWAYKWEENNWNKKGGIKNLELIKTIFKTTKNNPHIQICHVKGHNNNPMNELADKLAKKALQDYKKENQL